MNDFFLLIFLSIFFSDIVTRLYCVVNLPTSSVHYVTRKALPSFPELGCAGRAPPALFIFILVDLEEFLAESELEE